MSEEINNNITKNLKPKVAKIIDEFKVALTKGLNDGIKEGMEFRVYEQSEEIVDPDTGEILESLIVEKGTGLIVQVQKKISVLKSNQYYGYSSLAQAFNVLSEGRRIKPFSKNIKVGDFAQIIRCENCDNEIEENELNLHSNLCNNCLAKTEKNNFNESEDT